MNIHSYRLNNYRRLRDVNVSLAPDISILVGANNSGKTSATQALQTFLSGTKDRFSIFDFSSHTWKLLNGLAEADPDTIASESVPSITLDLWLEVAEADLYLVMPILPSTEWAGTLVGVRISFAVRNARELVADFKTLKEKAWQQAATLGTGAGAYIPWPKTVTEYLERELHTHFELRYYVLDRTQFDDKFVEAAGYSPPPLSGDQGGAQFLRSLIRVDCLSAQRHLADPTSDTSHGSGRAEDLSKRLSRFYMNRPGFVGDSVS